MKILTTVTFILLALLLIIINIGFTLEKFNEMMTKFVEELNQLTDTQYVIKLPEDEHKCAIISKLAS